jgi:hypothetical protein
MQRRLKSDSLMTGGRGESGSMSPSPGVYQSDLRGSSQQPLSPARGADAPGQPGLTIWRPKVLLLSAPGILLVVVGRLKRPGEFPPVSQLAYALSSRPRPLRVSGVAIEKALFSVKPDGSPFRH